MRTKFDRWLQRTFAIETQIYTLNDPGNVPRGVRKIALPEGHKSRFNYLLVITNQSIADKVVRYFQNHHVACKVLIVDRPGALAKFINDRPMLVFGCIWKILILLAIIGVASWVWFVFIPAYQDSSEKANSNQRIKLDKSGDSAKPALK